MPVATVGLSALAAAGALQAFQGSRGPKNIPAPPIIPDAPKAPDPTATFADAIARQKRRSASGSLGRSSTLLTGPAGDKQLLGQ